MGGRERDSVCACVRKRGRECVCSTMRGRVGGRESTDIPPNREGVMN